MYVTGPTVRGGFDPKLFASAGTAEPATRSNVVACLAHRLFALAGILVLFLEVPFRLL